jgi:hypothetical protein
MLTLTAKDAAFIIFFLPVTNTGSKCWSKNNMTIRHLSGYISICILNHTKPAFFQNFTATDEGLVD